jgi:adenine-specific DNA-methyltransferase
LDSIESKFDLIISNPPYFKLKKGSPEARAMTHLIHGQPNIYMLFMAKSADLLKETGEMVFITPRSFTSGAYFKRFREYLLDVVSLDHIHIFNTRREHFKNESILQETIITKFSKQNNQNITITSSEDSTFSYIEELSTAKDLIVEKYRNIICIPSSADDLEILDLFHAAPSTLQDLGYKISTGKVVTFRNKELLSTTPQSLFDEEKEYCPLLWMHNFKNDDLLFPLDHKKEQYIEFSDRSKALLIPTQNYLLIKRFSSKEQHRRINIGYLYKKDLPNSYIGLENHLNYLYRNDRELTSQEMKKLGSFLISAEVDQYFRILNGNTQVNAADILNLPVPPELYKG